MAIDREEVEKLTREYGGEWGLNHAKRIIELVSLIGEGLTYDGDVVWAAAYLHDWGGYSKWAVRGVDHAARSAQAAGAFMKQRAWPEETAGAVLECIKFHHAGGGMRIIESVLITDADALELVGVVGAARIFSMQPRDLRGAYESVRTSRAQAEKVITLEKSKELAATRIAETDKLLRVFEEETFGYF